MNGSTDDEPKLGVQGGGESLGRYDDDVYRALADRARRRVLAYLLDERESTVDKLAAVLVGWDAVDRESTTTADERSDWGIRLYHLHLPLLADVGLVDFDADAGTVELADLDPAVRDLIARSVADGS